MGFQIISFNVREILFLLVISRNVWIYNITHLNLTQRSSSKIARFSFEKIFDSQNAAVKIDPCFKSKNTFCCYYGDTTFTVMKNQKSVLGIQKKTKRIVIKEDITSSSSQNSLIFFKHKNIINSVLINEEMNILLAGDDNGVIVQYDLTTGKTLKNYENIGINDIVASHCLGPVAVIGGWRSYKIRFVFLDKRIVHGEPFRTGIHYISSSQFCVLGAASTESKQVLLGLSGYNPDFREFHFDLYNVTQLFKFYQSVVGNTTLVDFEGMDNLTLQHKTCVAKKVGARIECVFKQIQHKQRKKSLNSQN